MRLSTIIPAYNRAELIGETLRSVLSQSRPPAEVVVVDDGSSDGTAEAVTRFDASVRLIRQANAGAGAARNAGFAAASGEVVHFMDSDDLLAPGFYSAGLSAIERGADLTYAPWLKARIAGKTLAPERFVLQQGPVPDSTPLDRLALLVDWVTLFQCCLVRREVIERAGPFRLDLTPSEDTELLYRVLREARAPRHVAQALTIYRLHPENQVSAQNPARVVRDRGALWLALERHVATRADLDTATLRRFRRKKHDVAREVGGLDAALAERLDADVTALDRLSGPWRALGRRLAARLRVERTGNPYPPVFAAAPLSSKQRELIGRLGYEIGQG